MTKYSADLRLKIAKLVSDGVLTTTGAAAQYGMCKGDVQKWFALYEAHGIAGIERERRRYTGEFKQEVVEDMRKNHLSLRETAAKYNIGTTSVVSRWERIYLEEGAAALYKERRGRKDNFGKDRPPKLSEKEEKDLIAENQRLRMENDYLKKLNALVRERELSEKRKKLR